MTTKMWTQSASVNGKMQRPACRWLARVISICLSLAAITYSGRAQEPAMHPASPAPTAEEIVRAVAKNQTEAVEARQHWLFRQRVLVRLIRGNGKLAREELRHYEVHPKADKLERELKQLEGKVEIDGKQYPYGDPEYRTGDVDLDGEIAESFADDLMFGKESRDGIDGDLFPLLPEIAARHEFRLRGEEEYRGRKVYRLTFQPAKKAEGRERGRWKGEVLVDAEAMQPLLVITEQARGVPFAVRAFLGSNVKQFGFRLEYEEMEEGVWFPSRYSGEFSLRVLFGYSRRIGLSLENFDFQKAAADSVIRYGGEVENHTELQRDYR